MPILSVPLGMGDAGRRGDKDGEKPGDVPFGGVGGVREEVRARGRGGVCLEEGEEAAPKRGVNCSAGESCFFFSATSVWKERSVV